MIFRAGPRLVAVAEEVVATISSFSRRSENNREAGGILVGTYRGPHIQIGSCSVPMARDGRTVTMFDRRDPGHQQFALKNWRESRQTRTFVGEWHTHPERNPSPSRLDLQTWHRVAVANNAGNTFFLIRGFQGWWAGLAVGKTLMHMTLVPQVDE